MIFSQNGRFLKNPSTIQNLSSNKTSAIKANFLFICKTSCPIIEATPAAKADFRWKVDFLIKNLKFQAFFWLLDFPTVNWNQQTTIKHH